MTPETVRDLLSRIEWEGDANAYDCPYCRMGRQHGHATGCELKRILDVSTALSSLLEGEKVASV